MVVFLHVVVALLGMVYATLSFFSPSKARLVTAYGFMAITIASGIYLVWLTPSRMLHVCVAGLLYAVVTGVLTFAARARFIRQQKGSANS